MLPHPYKTDTWTDAERIRGNNLCEEIFQPMSGNTLCTLGMKPSMLKYATLNNDIHQHQVHSRVWELIGDPNLKMLYSSFSGSVPSQHMDSQEVMDLARELYDEHEENLTELYKTLGAVRHIQFQERTKLMGSFAVQQSLKEKGIMTLLTEQSEQIAKLTQAKEHGVFGGERRGEISIISSHNNKMGDALTVPETPDTVELTRLIEEAGEVNVNSTKHKMTVADYDGDSKRRQKRKKSKPKSNHLPNMRNARTKRVLGATILNMLGKVQQDTQDSYKRSLLKEIPLADFVELASGEKLPDYQANLLNAMQAKADPSAPIVERVSREVKDQAEEPVTAAVLGRGLTSPLLHMDVPAVELTNEERQATFEQNLDNALARYITPDLLPDDLQGEKHAEIVAQVRAAVLKNNMSIDRQTLVTEAMSIAHPLETIVA